MPSTTLLDAETGGSIYTWNTGWRYWWLLPGASEASYLPGHPNRLLCSSYAPNISRLDRTRAIKGRMPNSVEMASDWSRRDKALSTLDSPRSW